MHLLQNTHFKIAVVISTLLPGTAGAGFAQDYSALTTRADSLFSQKKYTQSYELYDSIYFDGKTTSPAMLLKMAYIQEGLGDYTMALFFLNDYYTLTSDDQVLEKMEELAEVHHLAGYDYSDTDYFLSVYHDYYNELIIALGVICLLFLGGSIYQRFYLKTKPVGNFIFLSFFAIALTAALNFRQGFKEGIIIHPNTYIMEEPSSSSDVLAIVSPGHKIPIRTARDVWLETRWNDRPAYIKRKNVIPINKW